VTIRRAELSAGLGALDGEIEAELERLSGLGYLHVQLSATRPGLRPRDLDGAERRAFRGTLRRREIAVSGLDLWIPAGHFADAAHVDRAVGAVREAIEFAAEFGRVPLSLSFPAPVEGAGLLDSVRAVLAHADHHGVEVVDHTAPIRPGSPAVVVGELIDALARPQSTTTPHPPSDAAEQARIRVGIDPAALLARGEDPARAVLALGDRIGAVRLCDLTLSGMRAPIADFRCGAASQDAQLDVLEFAVALSVAGFAGPIVVDARQWPDPWAGFEQTRAVWLRTAIV